MKRIINILNKLKDIKYASFQSKLIPSANQSSFIGVRTPELKKIAKILASYINDDKLTKQYEINKADTLKFLNELPHKYFDEMQLHAFIISELKDFDICIKRVNEFLPYIDNWATCDQLSPKVFIKEKVLLLKHIDKWLESKKPYIIRFGIGMLMQHFLDKDFDKKYLKKVENINYSEKNISNINKNKDNYYVEMMRAWYFATALAKQYEATLPIIKKKKLNKWTQNKAIQKAKESFRVTNVHKKELLKYIIK